MKKEEIFAEIRKIMQDYLGKVIVENMSMKSDLKVDLGMDSMDILYVVFIVQNTFDIEISDDEMNTFITVADIVNAVEAKLSKN
jgi:acyl carrier protein